MEADSYSAREVPAISHILFGSDLLIEAEDSRAVHHASWSTITQLQLKDGLKMYDVTASTPFLL